MSHHDDHPHQQALTPGEAARLLRELADQLERGVLLLDQREVRLEHALVLEQSLKPEEQGLAYRLKLKYKPAAGHTPAPAEPMGAQAATAPTGFKGLKHALSAPFKEIKNALAAGGLPPAELARGLEQSCRLLAEQRGGQDQGFLDLARQAARLLEAVRQGDLAQADQAVQAMASLKSACHAKGK